MHPALLAVLSDATLPASAKAVYSHVYAYTNGTLETDIPLDDLCVGLRMSESTLRRNRAALRSAGCLESWYTYGEEGAVVLHCELRAPSARDDDPDAHLVRVEDDQRAPSARAASARPMRADAQNAKSAVYGISLKVGRLEVKDQPPNLGGGVGEPDRGAALLVDCGIDATTAALSARQPFEQLARHVARWQEDLAVGKVDGPGALVYRINRGSPGRLPLTAEQLTAGVLADHVTPDDLRAWGVQRKPTGLEPYDVPEGYEGIIQH